MSTEVEFKYFLDGVEVDKKDINFDQDLDIRVVEDIVNITTKNKNE